MRLTLPPFRIFPLLITMAASCTPLASSAGKSDSPPNILLILVDDMGYSDIGCYGGEIHTPTLDHLAETGVRYARFYNAAQCCPSRASLLTGLYPHQAGMGDMNSRGPESPFWQKIGSPAYLGFKKEGIITLPEALREAGYQTFMSGKWHLGDTPDNWPSERGFERTFSLVIGASEHFTGYHSWQSKGPIAPFILDGKKLDSLPEDFYSTDTFTDYAMEFIGEAKPGKPWFCYLAYTAPHWPIQAHERDVAKYETTYAEGPEPIRQQRAARQREMGLLPPDAPLPTLDEGIPEVSQSLKEGEGEIWMRRYAGMIDCVDQNIARLVEFLKARGEYENTLILFLSDNGADGVRGAGWGQVSNTPFRRFKVWTHDGGIATPLIMHWPAGIPNSQNGKIVGGHGHFVDIFPTCLAAAGTKLPSTYAGKPVTPVEGIDLLPSAAGKNPLPDGRLLYWERQGNEAVRMGDWKLVRGYAKPPMGSEPEGNGPRTGEWELYNTSEDPGETRNLASEFPDKVTELVGAFEKWAERIGVIPREKIVEISGQSARQK